MFYYAYRFNSDISKWDVSSVNSWGMGQMFYYASAFNHDVSGWRGPATESSQSNMFYGATAFIDRYLCAEVHRNWNSGSVMPSNCTAQNSTWVSPSPPPPSSSPPPSPPPPSPPPPYPPAPPPSVTLVPLTDSTLASAVQSCLNEDYRYGMCTDFGFESGYGTMPYWDVSQVTQMNNTFEWRSSFNGFLDRWDVSNVKNMTRMFYYAMNFNMDLSTWDVSSVVDMSYMFSGASKFNSDVSRWRGVAASNPQSYMFDNAYAFTSKYACLTSYDGPANTCSLIPLTNNNFQNSISNCLSSSSDSMCVSSPYGVMSSWNTSLVTNMAYGFSNSYYINYDFIDLSSWDVSSVTSMSYMFAEQY